MRSAVIVLPGPHRPLSLRRGFLLLFSLLLLLTLTIGPCIVQAQDPLPLAALCDSARAHLERGDVEGARTLYQQVLSRDRNYPPAVLGMGRAILQIPNRAYDALEYLRRATSLMPEAPEAHYQRALAHLRLARGLGGGDDAVAARRELERVIVLDPSHPDAWRQLGILYRDVIGDPDKASQAFRTQVAADPGNTEARYDNLRTFMDYGEWEAAVSDAEEMLRRMPEDPRPYPYLAGALWKLGRGDEAMRIFEDYFGRIEPKERDLYFDLTLILDHGEIAEVERLSPQGRRGWWDHYWAVRDPDPKTAVNERLLEHFIRVAWARVAFGEKKWPWDERGPAYVRYGEPDLKAERGSAIVWDLAVGDWWEWVDRRQKFELAMGMPYAYVFALGRSMPPDAQEDTSTPTGAASELFSNLTGKWAYLDRGIELNFYDPIGSGIYLSENMSTMLLDQMERRFPVASEEEDKIGYVDPMDGVYTFRGQEGRTAVEYAFALLPGDFGQFRSYTGLYAQLDVDVRVFTPEWTEVARAGGAAKRLQTVPQVRIRGIPLFVDATRLEVPPGEYRIATLLLDPESGQRARTEEEVSLPDYSGGELMVSDILPAAAVREVPRGTEGRFVRGNLEVLPLPGRALQSDQPLFVYYEVYNLRKDPVGATDYEVSYAVGEAPDEGGLGARLYQGLKSLVGVGRRRTVLTARVERSGITTDSGEYLEIDMSAVPAGTWLLELTVTDRLTRVSTSQRLLFRTLPFR